MAVQLTNNTTKNVPVGLMNDGDIAIITNCGNSEYIGNIVTRYGDSLVAFIGKSWINYFPTRSSLMQVRILESGEQITVI